MSTFSANHPFGVYFIIIIVGFAEGPVLSVLCGLLLAGGYMNFFGVYGALMLGDLIGDVMWYYIGYHFGHSFINRFGRYFNITDEHVVKLKDIFHRFKNKILFFSKITSGFGFAILILFTAGFSRIPFRRYIAINFIGQFFWSGLLIFLGYSFGSMYSQIASIGGRIALFGVFAFLAMLLWGVRNYLKSRFKINEL